MTNEAPPDLFAQLDQAAGALLKRAMEDDGVPMVERMKAFDSVARFAENRAKANPPPKKKAKFDGLKSRVHGTGRNANGRGGASPEGETDPDAGESADA